ncbi:J domain-containing protein [Paraburkholderia domus]|nr:J domain-containing protein [Paraburkholderia domus]MBK5052250.1 J domain-containing protein [Burkholderia sp. R-70006]MBK5060336.1 J domain-containing protein [Burkholderia sp. R-70199]MBK5085360.1 J domain-containing protein [Burkholderia sp. R-69927]MBK5122603.1 J domain-containing protein [Burkholderia sp. R-69980]MBK5168833.1 J domain-containing protein [Burkholderia sp. R-70211]MBK5186386.1 J domain-containing protein [Burkholderia sp. R-69749]MCI0152178.1 DnaJ domain-containing pro
MATLYDTLGVHVHATDEEIKRAYRKAAMKWHPDRNSGAEEVARATFQEIKDAYAILSDAAQRKVYDAVYAEQMRGWEAQRTRQQKAQAEREAAARAADEAAYAEMVSLAMRFADDGHNRDVLFGVLLGRRCEAQRAAQIADSVSALQASRREAEKAEAAAEAAAKAADVPDVSARAEATTANDDAANRGTPPNHGNSGKREENANDAHPAGVLGGLWFQFLNGLRF